ncbi:uncharacterized protein LOC126835971 [Adelges cooleyi]|uniref:uncharacterized protein LOC126835971 n=1 Tax=Adelges cooleyi TaxID=133065 RepID=UPI0021809AD4|nr:uncharacterized protein LOC126835971 [Adelges cooleyi]
MDATNRLIVIHYFNGTLWNKIKEIVGLDYDMERLIYMCALSGLQFQNMDLYQTALEARLQGIVLRDSGLHPIDAAFLGNDRLNVITLGMARRRMFLVSLSEFITDIINNPEKHNIGFFYQCRIVALFYSSKFPNRNTYSTDAIVSADDTCIISNYGNIMMSFKYRGGILHIVNNENHSTFGESILTSFLKIT